MTKNNNTDFPGLWALLWRSLLFVPFMLLAFICLGTYLLSLWVLPVYGTAMLFFDEWFKGGIFFAVWVGLLWGYRRWKLGRFFERPQSLL